MRLKYIIGIAIAITFVVVAIFALNSSAIEYANFDQAIQSGKKVQVTGSWVKEKPVEYKAEKNLFTFFMKDKQNKEIQVIFNGAKPQNFDIANYFVATGKFDNGLFYASDILTKCPSKYEGQIDDLKKKSAQETKVN